MFLVATDEAIKGFRISSFSAQIEAIVLYQRDIWQLISQSPETFKCGGIWDVMTTINGSLQAVGYSLLVLFFVVGIMKSTTNLHEIRRPEAFRFFIRFAIAKAAIKSA